MKKFNRIEPGYFIPTIALERNLSYPNIGNEYCYKIEKNSQWFRARNKFLEQAFIGFPLMEILLT
jgi:hypothetical protein